ncbi:chemotaxis protein MotA [Pseudobutyrivibrio sp. YE44]|uniref:motility protein A n=1 Tax=Pseudobutyrivibrio sp. YE44 TaxID=1520802 RepID=UPI00088393D2|nr:motility protein A [Pseudobutyrivibrio sp. YE44]SDB11250.1 chemotaxis protein MotA [Pseudobutyrivibrio sp. YE44]
MDLASLVGMVLGVVMVVFGIVSSGGVAAMANFIDVPSVIITIGGSISSVMVSNKMPDFVGGLKAFGVAMKEPAIPNAADSIGQIINLANISRKEGILALEEAAHSIEDDFLKKGINLVVDGTDPELVRAILETDLANMSDRHGVRKKFWDKWGEMGPAWGMIGTLVGLVNMLKNLSDASTIGPSMAVALLTTLYGSLIANWMTGPISAKLAVNDNLEVMSRSITVEGLLSIQAGENPRVIEEKLKSFLPPSAREGIGGDGGGGEG